MVIERAGRHVRGGGDVLHRGLVVAALDEAQPRGVQNASPGLGAVARRGSPEPANASHIAIKPECGGTRDMHVSARSGAYRVADVARALCSNVSGVPILDQNTTTWPRSAMLCRPVLAQPAD